MPWTGFDAYYLYNPFGEHVLGTPRIDGAIALGKAIYRRYVEVTECRLAEAPRGTRVALYHGFGGKQPADYETIVSERRGGGFLELWLKRH